MDMSSMVLFPECRDDIQILGGAELQPRFFHQKVAGCAADQHVLAGMRAELLPELRKTSHHSMPPRSASRADWTRSSVLSFNER